MNKRTGRLAHVDESGRWQDGARPSISVVPRAPASAEPARPQPRPPATTRPSQENPYANMQPGVYQNGQMIPGDMTSAINTAMQRNAATAHLYNQAQAPYSFFGNALGMDLGAPQSNPQAMFRQAQEMVNAGWQNPLQRYFDEADTAQRLAQQAPPSMYPPSGPANPSPAGRPFGNDSLPPPVQRGGSGQPILIQQGGSDQRMTAPQRSAHRRRTLLPLQPRATPPRTPEEAARRDYDNQMNSALERQRGPQIGKRSSPWLDPQELARERAEAQQLRERLNAEQGRIAREREAVALYHRQKQWAAEQQYDNAAVMAGNQRSR
jgi:hypothetical protein